MKKSRRLEMTWPIPNGRARYEQAAALAQIAEDMRRLGIRVDVGAAREHQAGAEARAARFTELFLQTTGLSQKDLGESGAGATDVVRDWFWLTMGAPKLIFDKKTKKPQFNSPLLLCYAQDFKHEPYAMAAAALLGLRKAKTARKFAEAYEQIGVRHNGRIHFAFNIFGTKGERWSSSASFFWRTADGEPVRYSVNCQNVPSKEPTFDFGSGEEKLALSLRNCFIPDPGMVYAKFDYDALEGQLIRCNSGSKRLAQWMDSGADVHMENAKLLFTEMSKKIPPELWKKHKNTLPNTPEHMVMLAREGAKPVLYGGSYQYSDPNRENEYPELYKQLKKLFPNGNDVYFRTVVQRLYAAHPEIVEMQQRLARNIRETNRVELPISQGFLYLPAIPRGFNQAINAIHQSGGGALINRALVKIAADLPKFPGAAVLAQVHDELDLQIPENLVAEVCEMVEYHMSAPTDFNGVTVSIKAEGDVGPNWRDVKGRQK